MLSIAFYKEVTKYPAIEDTSSCWSREVFICPAKHFVIYSKDLFKLAHAVMKFIFVKVRFSHIKDSSNFYMMNIKNGSFSRFSISALQMHS